MTGCENDRRRVDRIQLSIRVMERRDADDLASGIGQQRRDRRLFKLAHIYLLKLLAASIHKQHAGLALFVGCDVAHPANAGDDVALIVAAKIKAGLVELGIKDFLDPCTGLGKITLVNEKIVPVFGKILEGVLLLLFCGVKHAAAENEITREYRAAAFADEPLGDDNWIKPKLLQTQRCITS